MTSLILILELLTAIGAVWAITLLWNFVQEDVPRGETYHGHGWCGDCRRSVSLNRHGSCSVCGSESVAVLK